MEKSDPDKEFRKNLIKAALLVILIVSALPASIFLPGENI